MSDPVAGQLIDALASQLPDGTLDSEHYRLALALTVARAFSPPGEASELEASLFAAVARAAEIDPTDDDQTVRSKLSEFEARHPVPPSALQALLRVLRAHKGVGTTDLSASARALMGIVRPTKAADSAPRTGLGLVAFMGVALNKDEA